ncbi:MAG: DUF2997 domain-containing protein [Chloroflexota bacterium]
MPEVEFTIDPTTGQLEVHVRGIVGPACDNVARVVKDLLGEPSQERKTAEYHRRTHVRPRIRAKPGT